MAFTYVSPTSDRDKVRFLIGDTVSAEAHFQDDEIAFLLDTHVQVFDAAIAAAVKASGIAKLLALGLTEEEANALVK